MERKFRKYLTACLAAAILVAWPATGLLARSGDDCRARCEVRYKQCAQACKGDTQCMVRCRESKSSCVRSCN